MSNLGCEINDDKLTSERIQHMKHQNKAYQTMKSIKCEK